MSIEDGLSRITNEAELLCTFLLLEEKARSALQSGSITSQEYIQKSEIIIEKMQKHLKVEHVLNDLANRIDAEQDEIEKHFQVEYYTHYPNPPQTKLEFIINYKSCGGRVVNRGYGFGLVQVLGDHATHLESWWERLELDFGYSFIEDHRQNQLVWKVECINMIRNPYYRDFSFPIYYSSEESPSKYWELKFNNNQDGVQSFHSQFNTIIDEMHEESLKSR